MHVFRGCIPRLLQKTISENGPSYDTSSQYHFQSNAWIYTIQKKKKKHVFLQNLPHYARPTLQLPSNQVSQHTASSLIRNPNETLCETLVTNMLYVSQDTHISQESSINQTLPSLVANTSILNQ